MALISGQSGLGSAIGMAIEDVWRTVPVPVAGTAKTVGKATAVTNSYTDLASSAPYTTVSSVARPFVVGDVNSILKLTAGTGFTPGNYYILSVAGGIATLDRVCAIAPASAGIAVLGTPANPQRFMIVEPGGGLNAKPTIQVPAEIDGVFGQKRTIITEKMYDGMYAIKADPEVLAYQCLGMFGKCVQTNPQTSPVNVYKQVFTNNPKGYQPSFTVEELFGDKTIGRLSSGMVLEEMTIDFTDVVSVQLKYCPFRQIPNNYPDPNNANVLTDYSYGSTPALYPAQMGGNATNTLVATASPVYVDVASQSGGGNGPFTWASAMLGTASGFAANYITINDVGYSVDLLKGLSLTYQRVLDKRQTAGSGYDQGAVVLNMQKVTGRGLSFLFKNTTGLLETLKHSKFGLNFQLVGNTIGATGLPYAMEVYLPRCRLLEAGLTVPDAAMTVGGTFVAEIDPTLNYDSQITLYNTFDMTFLGGNAVTNVGGPGGWSNV